MASVKDNLIAARSWDVQIGVTIRADSLEDAIEIAEQIRSADVTVMTVDVVADRAISSQEQSE